VTRLSTYVVLKRLFILCTCLALTACSWWPFGDSEEAPPSPKIIGVISMLSDHITVIDANGGWTRRSAVYPLDGWQVDQLAVQQASEWLQKHDYEPRVLIVNNAAFNAQALGGPVSRSGWLDRTRPDLAAIIRHAAQPADLPYYLVLVEASGSDSIPDMHGIGLVRFSGRPQAFVLYHCFLIDGKSGEIIDNVHADRDSTTWGASAPIAGPNADLPKAAWPKQVDAWSAEQQAAFRDAVESELKTSLRTNLRRLDLP
jgi:hypothetical protein